MLLCGAGLMMTGRGWTPARQRTAWGGGATEALEGVCNTAEVEAEGQEACHLRGMETRWESTEAKLRTLACARRAGGTWGEATVMMDLWDLAACMLARAWTASTACRMTGQTSRSVLRPHLSLPLPRFEPLVHTTGERSRGVVQATQFSLGDGPMAPWHARISVEDEAWGRRTSLDQNIESVELERAVAESCVYSIPSLA